MLCFINPGHKVGIDSGAVNVNGTQEAVIALEIGILLEKYLNAAGVETVLLQSNSLNGEDSDADNPSICASANDSGADIFVSLHCNAANCRASGTETLVYELAGKSAILADCIQAELIDALNTMDRGIKERPDLCVLRATDMPACLVEMAFVDNPGDCELLIERKDDIARAIARGITDYQQVI